MENLKKMVIDSFQLKQIGERNYQTTKNHHEINQDIEGGGVLPDMEGNQKSPFQVLSFYKQKLNVNCNSMWQRPRPNYLLNDSSWFENRPLGLNFLSKMMQNMCIKCGLDTKYANHSMRATACSLLGGLGYSDTDVRSVSLHKSVSSLAI